VEDLDRLRERWQGLVVQLDITREKAGVAFDALVGAYSGASRYYHNLRHLEAVLNFVGRLADLAEDLPAVQLAAWYHDVVYDPRAADNEEQSALLAEKGCASWGLEGGRTARVGAMIRATKTHQGDDADTLVLLDADLSILGADEGDYDRYAAAIRQEYGWVADETYRQGRAGVLEGFLRREHVYRLERMRGWREQAARDNLAREIAQLTCPPKQQP
jgi:predicted metal-dependent HD superfamily phosphohydrolase